MKSKKEKFVLDRAGFPMILVEPKSGSEPVYVHWLPITKIQFEIFMCEMPSIDFSDTWYKEILKLNPRISPKNATKKNYWNLFITGLRPAEAEAYANWAIADEGELTLPTLDDWNSIYQYLKTQPPLVDPFVKLKLSERIKLLISKVDSIVENLYKSAKFPYSLADQMLMRYGVMEWVQYESRGQDWAGMGQTDAGLQSMLRNPDSGVPEIPKNIETNRFHYYGFRLVKR
jgi:hypothetical protein